jgi:hypothetical protein
MLSSPEVPHMRKHTTWIRRAVLVLAAAGLAACADSADPAGRLLQPEAPALAKGGHKALQKVAGDAGDFTVSALINRQGGTLSYGGYTLVVPQNSVRHPTVFTLHALATGYLEVELTATSTGSKEPNDQGRQGFSVPVRLTIPVGTPEEGVEYVVAWVRPDGVLEAMPSTLDGSSVTGRLTHFSQYTAATD